MLESRTRWRQTAIESRPILGQVSKTHCYYRNHADGCQASNDLQISSSMFIQSLEFLMLPSSIVLLPLHHLAFCLKSWNLANLRHDCDQEN
ncbi:hypothetical protein AAC387_Pa12g1781 [Persea americana]